MAKSEVTKLQLNTAGLNKLLKGAEVSDFLMGLADDVARDASAQSGEEREYDTHLRTNRDSRNVATVRDLSDDAMKYEADNGFLNRAANKERG